ncbi:MAG TPA: sulfate ABC transporter substrate-binding protein [Herpetosiphonaceae bacterium]
MSKRVTTLLLILMLSTLLAACGSGTTSGTDSTGTGTQASTAPEASASSAAGTDASAAPAAQDGEITLTLGAYTTPREAYKELIPIFQERWKQQTGQTVNFEESYLGSGAQSRAIVEGFEADIAALSLEADITRIQEAGLITHDWKSAQDNGMISTSVVAFAVRPGNPKGIKDWGDLGKAGVEVLTPNPQTSGGAMWNVLALYGAAHRGFVDGVAKGDDAAATEFLKAVLKNVTVLDKGARESITNFEKGVGDVAITYENEVLVAKQAGEQMDLVIPRSTILIENPIAIIDTYVDKHGTRQVADEFVKFLYTEEAQTIFAKYGLRSLDKEVAQATTAQYPAVEDLWTVQEFGGWSKVTPDFFGDTGIYTKAIAEVQGQ